MKQKLVNLATLVSLLFCVATVALAIYSRSSSTAVIIQRVGPAYPRGLHFISYDRTGVMIFPTGEHGALRGLLLRLENLIYFDDRDHFC